MKFLEYAVKMKWVVDFEDGRFLNRGVQHSWDLWREAWRMSEEQELEW